jgi:D-beta-D-heptose 7-phosphate kinase/D-beta-D-heptose 1-phosphate adenosyltransferase
MSLDAQRLRRILARFPEQRIVVVGDLMLDRYIHGAVERISPEAPVPVVRVREERRVPGGASNVAWNVRALGGEAAVCGVVGRDAAGRELLALLGRRGIRTAGVQARPGVRTTVKTRVIAERQQVVRIDWEDRLEWPATASERFCARVEREVAKASGVILEDYGKGVVVQPVVEAALRSARRAGVPSGLDPKDNEQLRVRGITVATPNRREAFVGAGRADPGAGPDPLRDVALLGTARALLRRWQPRHLVVTLGPQGMLLAAPGERPRHIPTRAREVFDVSGAGDTVIAACLLSLAAGATHEEAAEIANYAAGVVVGKIGTATCTPAELLRYVAAT